MLAEGAKEISFTDKNARLYNNLLRFFFYNLLNSVKSIDYDRVRTLSEFGFSMENLPK